MSADATTARDDGSPAAAGRLGAELDGSPRTDEMSRALWATDASLGRRRPLAVAERDVRHLLAAAQAAAPFVSPSTLPTASVPGRTGRVETVVEGDSKWCNPGRASA